MTHVPLTPLLADDSPLDTRSRRLVEELFEREARLMDGLPTDHPLDDKRRRRVELTRPEILGQADAIRSTIEGERAAIVDAGEAVAGMRIRRVILTGCGDSLAVMIGARLFLEQVLGIPCEPVGALDFAYYAAGTVGPETLVVTLSSSGATTRTVEAMLIGRARGARTLALSNTPGSALMAESDRSLLVRAERKGWPTQASTAALALLLQFALAWARAAGRDPTQVDTLQAALDAIPGQIETVLGRHDAAVAEIAEREAEGVAYLYAGGGPAYAAALFGAAKVSECTPDRGIAIGLEEFHHYNSQKAQEPLFVIAPRGPSVPRARDTAFEGRRWGGRIYSLVEEGDARLDALSDRVLGMPAVPESLAALVYPVPLQCFAYHLAMAKFRRAGAI